MVTGRRGRIGILLGVAAAGRRASPGGCRRCRRIPPIIASPTPGRFLGVPNALNVLSNLAFLIAGGVGLSLVVGGAGRVAFVDGRERWPWARVLRGPRPDRARLGLVSPRSGQCPAGLGPAAHDGGLHGPLRRHDRRAHRAARRARSCWARCWWRARAACSGGTRGEVAGRGDLRPYGLVQFFPMLAIPLLAWLLPAALHARWVLGPRGADLCRSPRDSSWRTPTCSRWAELMSGHSLKHLGGGAGRRHVRPHARAPHHYSTEDDDDRRRDSGQGAGPAPPHRGPGPGHPAHGRGGQVLRGHPPPAHRRAGRGGAGAEAPPRPPHLAPA